MRKLGRPKKIIDYELVERLAKIHCTHEEIATALGVSISHLEHDAEFLQVYKKGLDEGKKSLRRMQWEAAEGKEGEVFYDKHGKVMVDDKGRPLYRIAPQSPNVTMQIWLGKQLLGQKDTVEHETGEKLSQLLNEMVANRLK